MFAGLRSQLRSSLLPRNPIARRLSSQTLRTRPRPRQNLLRPGHAARRIPYRNRLKDPVRVRIDFGDSSVQEVGHPVPALTGCNRLWAVANVYRAALYGSGVPGRRGRRSRTRHSLPRPLRSAMSSRNGLVYRPRLSASHPSASGSMWDMESSMLFATHTPPATHGDSRYSGLPGTSNGLERPSSSLGADSGDGRAARCWLTQTDPCLQRSQKDRHPRGSCPRRPIRSRSIWTTAPRSGSVTHAPSPW